MAMTLRLIPELQERAAAQCERTGISMSKLIALALDNYLTFTERNQPRRQRVSEPPPERAPSSSPTDFDSAPRKSLEDIRASFPKTRKVGVNEPCPCGSGIKFKKCCQLAGYSR